MMQELDSSVRWTAGHEKQSEAMTEALWVGRNRDVKGPMSS